VIKVTLLIRDVGSKMRADRPAYFLSWTTGSPWTTGSVCAISSPAFWHSSSSYDPKVYYPELRWVEFQALYIKDHIDARRRSWNVTSMASRENSGSLWMFASYSVQLSNKWEQVCNRIKDHIVSSRIPMSTSCIFLPPFHLHISYEQPSNKTKNRYKSLTKQKPP
jgi:hypothetical protein